ncbi:PLDc N-terminal domain-containing protein [Cellulomonas iranensis]|uniref:PLDc N-terminal domain-containing protein n=1 Tax=Cellulomonas iranensis TaxID=76862 RepID=UPI001CF55E5F|nr:PLDc N-terminal domain-containing protein [Cellulomonas iranensis]UCN15564.1 PLDc N-terminal domain-containing protein [Cellulomonas iranensis]
MLRYLPFVLIVAFALYCAFDVLGSDARRRRGVPTLVWVLVVLLPVLGGVVWLLVSRSAPGAGQARAARGPVAPDDDPEFLRRLDLERRRREQQARGDDTDDAASA